MGKGRIRLSQGTDQPRACICRALYPRVRNFTVIWNTDQLTEPRAEEAGASKQQDWAGTGGSRKQEGALSV